jgi:RNA polymerase sigma-70 factor, ECF subfamily
VGDEEIQAALRRKDTNTAFRLLMQHHGRAVYTLCYRILRDSAAAEDMMQETLISAFEHPAQMLEVIHLRRWLKRIATRKCLDALRASKRVQKLQDALLTADAPELAPDLLARLATTQERGLLEECLAALDPETATAVELRYREALPWEEIAQALELPPDTIRMRVLRALPSLRACLTSKGIEL